jgi:microcystin-dependent protein
MKRLIYSITVVASVFCAAPRPAVAQAASPYLGEIQMFATTFCPKGWSALNGQLLPISTYVALFALLGTRYGGDGASTFALPKWGPIFTANGGTLTPCIAMQGVFPSQN